jgi:ubiquinol-cytochrome c reductase iron-sulfur subunit
MSRPERERIVPAAPPDPGAERALIGLLFAVALFAVVFIAVYAVNGVGHRTQLLGLALGLAFVTLAAAFTVIAKRLVVTELVAEEYPPDEHLQSEGEIEQLVEESGERFTRRRLVTVAGASAAGALGAALIVPIAGLGPVFDLGSFVATPWARGRRLVDGSGRPLLATAIEEGDFYTAYPEGADREQLAAPLVVVRLPVSQLHLPAGRDGWAPGGILAYSKICTHAACAISLYRTPTFPEVEPGPALVCPCHYSTFDPATGGAVLFGPAGRPLPQLPLEVGPEGELRAGGNFSGPVGPAWWGVRSRRPT